MAGRSTIRQSVGPALGSLRAYWGSAVLAAVTGAVAIGAALPVARLATLGGGVGSRLRLAAARPLDAGFLWLHAEGPAEVRAAAVTLLFKLLAGVAAGLVAVALLTLLSVFVARASARGPEIAIRRAVGASGRLLLGAQLIEGALLAAAGLLGGGAVGLVIARLLGAWPGTLAPAAGHVSLAVAVVVTGTMMVGALLPVAMGHQPARSTAVDPTPLALVIPAVQLGLSLTVLVTASMLRLGASRLEWPAAVAGEGALYEIGAASQPAAQRAASYGDLLRRLKTDPRVTLASLSSSGAQVRLGTVALAVGESAFYAVHHVLSADSFGAMGLHVVAGRGLTDADGWSAPRTVVVNRTLARHLVSVGGPLILGYGPDAEHTVVGVVDDAPPLGLGGTRQPRFVVYASILQHPPADAQLLVRGAEGGPAASDVRLAIRAALGAGATVSRPISEASLFAAEAAPLRWFARAFAAEASAMLAVATGGTFAVMWLWVTSLFGELGLRRATGARRRDIIRFVLVRAGAVAGWGIAFGSWVGMMVWDAAYQLSESVPAWDPVALAWSSALLGVAALAGASIPTWRAARTPPATLVAAGGA